VARKKRPIPRAKIISSTSSSQPRTQSKQGFLGSLGVSAGKTVGTKTAGLLVANPIYAAIIIAISLILLFVIGTYAAVTFVDKITNPFLWAVSIVFTVLIRPVRTTTLVFTATIAGGLYFIYENWAAYNALQDTCAIPIIGMIVCGGIYTVWIFNLLMYILTALVMVMITRYIINLALKV